ncbi:MAG TPA: efflux RND transporter permease subunit [Anaeromyxobacter sp.]|nr:efflux RND transporter permease subunit [Anaeromyxobacter sp.]
MHLAEFAVRRWQLTLVLFAGVTLLGIASLLEIPKSEDPTFDFPNFAVVAVLPGATPADLERQVVRPLEARFQTIDDLKRTKTTIEDGVAVIQLEFTAGADAGRRRDDVLREATALRPSLPPEMVRLDVQEFNAAKVNVLQLALVSDTASSRALDGLSHRLRERLRAVPGVGDVQIDGLPAQEVRVEVDPERAVAWGVSPGEVIASLSAGSQSIPSGSVDAGPRQLSVKASGDFRSVDEVRDAVVRLAGGRAVHVRDLAQVVLGDAEPVHLLRVDGHRAVSVAANMKEGQNILAVREGLGAAVEEFRAQLPSGVSLAVAFDQARNVDHRLRGFARDFLIAIALVLVTLLPLGTRASLVVMVSIPLSLALGVALLRFAGFSVNQLSIVGFVIALGLLVDDSVVVVENITRWIRLGASPREAAVRATRQITLSVLGCTATLVFAFLPLLALPGSAGLFIRSMPVAVVFTILASLGVSLTVVPFLSSQLLRSYGSHGNLFFRGLTWAVDGSYRPVLRWALARPRLTLAGAALLVAGSVALVPRIGFSLFPKAGLPQVRVVVEAPEGASLSETDRAVRFAEGVLRGEPEVRSVVANVGKGNPRVYYNVSQQNEKASWGEILFELGTREPEAIGRALDRIRARLAGYPGATLQVLEFEQGPPVDAPVAIRVLGEDLGQLDAASRRVEEVLRSTPGTRYVKNPTRDRKSDLRVVVDRERAALAGVAVPEVDRTVRLAVGGVLAGRYREDGAEDARDVRVTYARAGAPTLPGAPRPTPEVLERVYLPGAAGAVPLRQVAELRLEPSPARIYRTDRIRSATVTAQVQEGYNTDRVTRAVLGRLAAARWPPGVRIVPAGELESRLESFGGLGSAIILAAMGVLAVLVLEFRTFRSTLIVASVIPLGVVGGLVALLLSGNTLSFTATVGFVALLGIEVKNSILLVDFTNQLRQEGLPLDEAVRRAGETRFVPVLLTTLTAMGGLVPLALERSALYSPLALVLLGGLLSSTLLARLVTPVLYRLLPPDLEEPAAERARPAPHRSELRGATAGAPEPGAA